MALAAEKSRSGGQTTMLTASPTRIPIEVSNSRSRRTWSWVLKPVVSTISPVAAIAVLSSRNHRTLPASSPITSSVETANVVSPR